MKTVNLENSSACTAMIDDSDYPMISQFKWYLRIRGTNWYAEASVNSKNVLMHRLILGLVETGRSVWTDHINGDGLDNRRENLRACAPAISNRNRNKTAGCHSVYKGVTRDPNRRGWKAYIYINSARKHLGIFDSEEEAAKAYDAAATEHFGSSAKLNQSRYGIIEETIAPLLGKVRPAESAGILLS